MVFQAIFIVIFSSLIAIAVLSRRSIKHRNQKTSICIMLGSGGHTTQICELFRKFNFQKCARISIIIGKTDNLSQPFFKHYFEELYKNNHTKMPNFNILKTKRTNQVKQSKLTSIFSTSLAFLNAFYLIITHLLGTTHLVSNGPGICVPYFYIFWLFNKLTITKTKLIFVESWCRVNSLSVAGKIVGRICDNYLVHWKQQAQIGKNITFAGQIL